MYPSDYDLLRLVVNENREFVYQFSREEDATQQAKSLHNTKRKFEDHEIRKIEITKELTHDGKWSVFIRQSKNKIFMVVNGEYIPLKEEK